MMEIIQDVNDDFSCTSSYVSQIACNASVNLLPQKSKDRYEKTYISFCEWCKKKKIEGFSENVLLIYFNEMAKGKLSSTLWSIYSMLKSTLVVKENVDISKYSRLIAFLKRKSVGYRAKKSKVLRREEMNKFLSEAPDDRYLLIKVSKIHSRCKKN